MNQSEKSLIENTSRAEAALAREQGGFSLFGLIQSEATAGKWDVVVSAPWLTMDRAGAQLIVDKLTECLTKADWLKTASVVPLPPDAEFVQSLTRRFQTEHELLETGGFFTDDVSVDRAFLITVNKNALVPVERPLAAA